MAAQSNVGDELLAQVAALGLPEIGRSSAGRSIYGGRWSRAAVARAAVEAPPLVVMAGIHGDEPASVAAVLDLCARWAGMVAPRDVWLVPALNPDGLAAGTKNCRQNVDLNRNFPARNFTLAHKAGYDPGPAPLSQPETAAFVALLDASRPWGVVAVHAPFACINHDGAAVAWADFVAAACGWPAQSDLGYPTPGSLGSWWGVDRGLPILTIELPKGPLSDFREAAFRALGAAVSFNPDSRARTRVGAA